MFMAPGHLDPFVGLVTIFCICLASGAAGAINMWYDRDIDAVMQRTITRPVPSGRIPQNEALAYGVGLSCLSVCLMWIATNTLAAAILAFSIFFYSVIYTMWLKRSTPQNIVIGGAAGAFPPMIGWAAATGHMAVMPVVMFGIVFFWTPPHFWSLALYACKDYGRAGIPMLPVVRACGIRVGRYFSILWFCWQSPLSRLLSGQVGGSTRSRRSCWGLALWPARCACCWSRRMKMVSARREIGQPGYRSGSRWRIFSSCSAAFWATTSFRYGCTEYDHTPPNPDTRAA